ncbi:MAG: hypothetical protein JWM82_4162, partial [Myxococcales bacterium]|nr:hypothetical protein [Myxococcales bacterium]
MTKSPSPSRFAAALPLSFSFALLCGACTGQISGVGPGAGVGPSGGAGNTGNTGSSGTAGPG